jgi:GntR family transcriptional regulator, transcriptional repressor for pyruvate dehydrogenase complex
MGDQAIADTIAATVPCRIAARVQEPEARHGQQGAAPPLTGLDDAGVLEHTMLHLLAAGQGPSGSGTLMEQLHDLGYGGSEPTVGRFLRTLDRRGLTVRVSNKGRALTEAGRRHLHRLCEAEAQRHYERELVQTIRGTTIDDLLDVLVARRALERETARLAAEYATAEEIAQLEAAIRAQQHDLKQQGIAIDADVRFHALIAEAGHNRVLAAAIALIRRDTQMSLLLDAILKQTAHKWVVGHDQILAAIKRRAPDDAEQAMLAHINTVIADVRRYRNRLDRVVATATDAPAP